MRALAATLCHLAALALSAEVVVQPAHPPRRVEHPLGEARAKHPVGLGEVTRRAGLGGRPSDAVTAHARPHRREFEARREPHRAQVAVARLAALTARRVSAVREAEVGGLHHDADFWFTHRIAAAESAARCADCHRDDACAACHDGRVRDRRTHPNDYLTQHPVDARLNANTCTSCHRQSTFCVACHERAGVAQSSAPAARAQTRFHPSPEVWSGRVVTARHHGVEARRSLNTCVSCHAERDCVTCHATLGAGGAGFSPHPPGFLARCGALLRASERPCRMCHEDLDGVAARCR